MPPKPGQAEQQIKVRLPRSLLQSVDDFRFNRRLESRNAAVVALIATAVDALKASNGSSGEASSTALPEKE